MTRVPVPVLVSAPVPPRMAEMVAVGVATLIVPELVSVRVPVPPKVTAPSSNVSPATPVTVPLTVTVNAPVALVPAEKFAMPVPAPMAAPQVVVAAVPRLLVDQ